MSVDTRGHVRPLQVSQSTASARNGKPAAHVVFAFFRVDWRSARQRGSRFAQDRLLEALMSDERVDGLVVGNPYRSLPAAIARGHVGRRRPATPGRRVSLVEPWRLRRSDPTRVAELKRTYERYDRLLARAATEAGLRRPAAITSNPFVAAFCPFEWARAVTYYATDDWPAHHGHAAWRSAYEVAHAKVAAGGRRVCAVSSVLGERIAPNGEFVVVPNGVEPSEWRSVGPPPAWFAALPRPRLLYAGTLDRRIDLELVRAVAGRFSQGAVALVGNLADPGHLAGLSDLSNVVVRPPVARPELAATVAAADACLLPHTVTPLTQAMSPLKVYEYLAGGRPVAAVDLPPLVGLDDRVVRSPPEGFVDAVVRALALPRLREEERLGFVEANSWRRRHERILSFALA